MNLVLDTNILVKGFEDAVPSCQAVLYHLFNNYELKVVFDTCDENGNTVVMKEYIDNLGDSKFFHKWYKELHSSQQISYFTGKLTNNIRQKLIRKRFHEQTDQTFVALAIESDKVLITEDSDYGKGDKIDAQEPEKQEVLRYLTQDLFLNIMDSKEGLPFLRNL